MIKIKIKKRTPLKVKKRWRNKARLRKKMFGTSQRPRLVVFRSNRHIYAQLVDDLLGGKVLAENNTLKLKGALGANKKGAEIVGENIALSAKKKKVEKVVFDRGGFIYHGRIKALAEAARQKGLKF